MALVDEKRNEKIQNLGKWIDKPFLEEILQEKLKEKVTIETFNISAAVADGENYLSTIYRTAVTFTTENSQEHQVKSIIIKGLPELQSTIDQVHELHAFEKEKCFYTVVQPYMGKLLGEYIPSETSVGPEGYFTNIADTLVLEDLGQDGYKMRSRVEQLDYEHCLAALRKLALLHALSRKMYHDDKTLGSGAISYQYAEANRPHANVFVEDGIRALAESIENWPEFEERAITAEKIRKTLPFVYEKVQTLEEAAGKFKVFNHGDAWVNNIMFKYGDDGKISSVKFVDFQISRRTSPAMDLYYTLFSSAQKDVLNEHYFELIKKYHDDLSSNISILGLSDHYALQQLHEDLKDYAVYGVVVVSGIAGIVLAPEPGEDAGLSADIFGDKDEHFFAPVHRSKRYQTYAISVLRLFERIGYLDDAVTRTQYIVDKMMGVEKEVDDFEGELANGEVNPRVMSAHNRHFIARLKSAARGVFRKFVDFS